MFARLNIQLAPKKDIEKIAAEIEDILYDAAIEAFAVEKPVPPNNKPNKKTTSDERHAHRPAKCCVVC
jgi:hypothetical protein